MGFIDSHCHIDMYSPEKVKTIIENARKENVEIIINNGVDIKSNRKTLELAKRYNQIKAALGIYPIDALKMSEDEIDKEISFIEDNREKIIAIGEIGIDLNYTCEINKQKHNFEKLIDMAARLDKPIIVHSRKAEAIVLEIMEQKKVKKALIHCFNGKLKLVEKIIKNNWYTSIPTNVVYSQNFQKLIEKMPLNLLLCETDSPYLHPIKSKKDNEPANVIMSYRKIADIKKIPLEIIKEDLENNYKRLFA